MSQPRFFLEHDMIHDRKTGKHVTTDVTPPFEDGIGDVCAFLNGLTVISDEDDRAWCEDLKERDEALELIADVAQHFGCNEEWSNAHDHRQCVRESIS